MAVCINIKHDRLIVDERNPDCRRSGHKPRKTPRKRSKKN